MAAKASNRPSPRCWMWGEAGRIQSRQTHHKEAMNLLSIEQCFHAIVTVYLSVHYIITKLPLWGIDFQWRHSHDGHHACKTQHLPWRNCLFSIHSDAVSKGGETAMKDKLSTLIRWHSFKTCQPALVRRPRFSLPCSHVISFPPCHMSAPFALICISLCLAGDPTRRQADNSNAS